MNLLKHIPIAFFVSDGITKDFCCLNELLKYVTKSTKKTILPHLVLCL